MTTNFTFVCQKWTDSDSPLTYEFSHESKGSRTVFFHHTVASGQNVSFTDWLPIGNELDGFKMNISVHIKDNLGAKTIRQFTLKVNYTAFINAEDFTDMISHRKQLLLFS